MLHSQGSSASAKPAPAVAEPPSTGSLTASSLTGSKAEPAAGDVLIELRNVHKSFGNKPILRGANIQVRRGEAVGIIGGSGTGKSTTLRIMAGLLMPDVVSCSLPQALPHAMDSYTPHSRVLQRKGVTRICTYKKACCLSGTVSFQTCPFLLMCSCYCNAVSIHDSFMP